MADIVLGTHGYIEFERLDSDTNPSIYFLVIKDASNKYFATFKVFSQGLDSQ